MPSTARKPCNAVVPLFLKLLEAMWLDLSFCRKERQDVHVIEMAPEMKAIVRAAQLDPRGRANQGEPRVPIHARRKFIPKEEVLPPHR